MKMCKSRLQCTVKMMVLFNLDVQVIQFNYKLNQIFRPAGFSDPDGFDVICSKTTSLDVVTVPFSRIAPSGSRRMDVAAVKALGPRQNVGELEAKVLSRAALSKIVLVNREECELKEIWVADTTGEIKLTLWDSLISQVDVSKSYCFSNLATREMQGVIRLTTTPSTRVVEITQLDVPDEGRDDPDDGAASTTLRGVVSGVQIRARHRCPRCHGLQNQISANSITHRCDACNLLQRSSVYGLTYRGTIVLTADQQEHSLTVTDSCINAYLARYRVAYSENDVETIEEHFLNLPEVEICVNNDSLITSLIQPLSQNRVDQSLVAANDGNTVTDGEAAQVVEDWEAAALV
ncbi:uncharacterized protein LOC113071649 [Carassius auratus]|uniref:Uncharacterized protein LOC113071649 n=1 Tax=Carassius auratus TaxID=7957 RepID=A0A6P6MXG6_CARAU|nr:uncharacterized protein LOC113071649 [Carassius auratus]